MSSEFVQLKSGRLVSVEAIRFALDLESQGFELSAPGDGNLHILRDKVRDTTVTLDKEKVKNLRWHLLVVAGLKETAS